MLYRLRHGSTFSELATVFGGSVSTLSASFNRCLDLMANLMKNAISVPSAEECEDEMVKLKRFFFSHKKNEPIQNWDNVWFVVYHRMGAASPEAVFVADCRDVAIDSKNPIWYSYKNRKSAQRVFCVVWRRTQKYVFVEPGVSRSNAVSSAIHFFPIQYPPGLPCGSDSWIAYNNEFCKLLEGSLRGKWTFGSLLLKCELCF